MRWAQSPPSTFVERGHERVPRVAFLSFHAILVTRWGTVPGGTTDHETQTGIGGDCRRWLDCYGVRRRQRCRAVYIHERKRRDGGDNTADDEDAGDRWDIGLRVVLEDLRPRSDRRLGPGHFGWHTDGRVVRLHRPLQPGDQQV